ncbi:MAG: hypothetical protein L0Z70_13095 [Chloroflexi bacterium]|nr:hypothetical protein [Chloroflexota bacterium]
MTVKLWETIKTHYCHHVQAEVGFQADLVYPPEWLPDQPPRILARRCTQGLGCNLDERASCTWAGSNPGIDPFIEDAL